jgi:hypothetical protein
MLEFYGAKVINQVQTSKFFLLFKPKDNQSLFGNNPVLLENNQSLFGNKHELLLNKAGLLMYH